MEETVSESVLPPQAPAPRLAPSVQEEEEEGLQVWRPGPAATSIKGFLMY